MRKFIESIGLFSLFALTWPAGHDILRGERDVRMEYGMVVVALFLAGFILITKIKRRWQI